MDDLLKNRSLNNFEIEYASLREETIRRMEARTQYISLTLTIGGAFLGIGWGQGAVALLLFPPIAALLASGWAQNETRAQHISTYIREHLEPQIPGLGWEKFSRQMDEKSRMSGSLIDLLAVGGLFVLVQVLAIFLGSFRFNPREIVEWVLLGIAVGSVVVVLMLINQVRAARG